MSTSVNLYDQATRYAPESDPDGFLRWLIPGLDPGWQYHAWLDTRILALPGESDGTCDLIAEIVATGSALEDESLPRWALLIEFQTRPRPKMLRRLLRYLARLSDSLRFGPSRTGEYDVAAILVSLTGAAQPVSMVMAMPGRNMPSIHFNAATRTLRDEDAATTLDQIATGQCARCVLCWISLMRGGDQPDIIERWKSVAEGEPDHSHRATYAAIVLIFAEQTGCVPACAPAWRAGICRNPRSSTNGFGSGRKRV